MNHIKKQLLQNFCIISLNRPDFKNAFDPVMIQEITETFQALNNEENIKAIIFKGEGTAFCSGADLNWMKSMVKFSFDENVLDSQKLWEMFEAIQSCKHPIIGQAHGAVFGGALGLLACCDYVFAEEKTKFCFSEVKLGLAPAVISHFILQKCPDAFVRPYMLSAEIFQSAAAKTMGLVHQIYLGDITVETIISKFSENGINGMRATKHLLNQISDQQNLTNKKLTTEAISQLRVSPEAQERLQKFLHQK